MSTRLNLAAPGGLNETELIRRARAREPEALRDIITRHNQRLYRLARAILRDDGEAEEALQEAYLRAFAAIGEFRGESSLSTWLSRIAINEALSRLRRRRKRAAAVAPVEASIIPFPMAGPADDPERSMAQRQILRLVEEASDSLPEIYRIVFVARVIEGLSVEETAESLGLRAATVRTRLHRARALIRQDLEARIGPLLLEAFPFAGRRCERLTQAVLARLQEPS